MSFLSVQNLNPSTFSPLFYTVFGHFLDRVKVYQNKPFLSKNDKINFFGQTAQKTAGATLCYIIFAQNAKQNLQKVLKRFSKTYNLKFTFNQKVYNLQK